MPSYSLMQFASGTKMLVEYTNTNKSYWAFSYADVVHRYVVELPDGQILRGEGRPEVNYHMKEVEVPIGQERFNQAWGRG